MLFAVIAFVLCRWLELGGGFTARVVVGCVLLCGLASAGAFLLAVFGSFYSEF